MIRSKEEMLEAKENIIRVSRELHEVGLLVRTWGNISQRIDDNSFLITPSGIKYEDLTPEMIVKVNIKDLSYEGDVLPSSEKAVHAACYKERPDVEFIVHTHQVYASCAGTLGIRKIVSYFDDEDIFIPVAPYALPGTDKLAENVAMTIKKFPDLNGIIWLIMERCALAEIPEKLFSKLKRWKLPATISFMTYAKLTCITE